METGCRHTGLVHRQWSLFFSVSLSIPAALPVVYPNFLPPSLATSSRSFQFPASIFIHSCQSSPAKVSPSFLARPLFIQPDVLTSLSIHSRQPCRRALTSVSPSPFITLSTCHVILFVSLTLHPSLSTCASSPLIPSISILSFWPFFSFL